eukprot:12698664-Ditylum_brightwellii.AAC.1
MMPCSNGSSKTCWMDKCWQDQTHQSGSTSRWTGQKMAWQQHCCKRKTPISKGGRGGIGSRGKVPV